MLSGICQSVICVQPQSYRAMDLAMIESALHHSFQSVQTAKTVSDALEKAKGKSVVVCGSFTLLKEAKAWIEKRQ
jgi:folylpolyglutamate synthase/dihydropteroate synthase